MTRERLIQRLLRVDHSGEHGAVAIYSAQLAYARRFYSDLTPWLEDTLAHERRHRKLFRDAMPSRQAKPCRMIFVWSWGGAILGALTALCGRTGVYVCTASVERTVHRHLLEQISFLDQADARLASVVRDILVEEDEHLRYAEEQHNPSTLFARGLGFVVSAATECLIFLSTRGDSMKLNEKLQGSFR